MRTSVVLKPQTVAFIDNYAIALGVSRSEVIRQLVEPAAPRLSALANKLLGVATERRMLLQGVSKAIERAYDDLPIHYSPKQSEPQKAKHAKLKRGKAVGSLTPNL